MNTNKLEMKNSTHTNYVENLNSNIFLKSLKISNMQNSVLAVCEN